MATRVNEGTAGSARCIPSDRDRAIQPAVFGEEVRARDPCFFFFAEPGDVAHANTPSIYIPATSDENRFSVSAPGLLQPGTHPPMSRARGRRRCLFFLPRPLPKRKHSFFRPGAYTRSHER